MYTVRMKSRDRNRYRKLLVRYGPVHMSAQDESIDQVSTDDIHSKSLCMSENTPSSDVGMRSKYNRFILYLLLYSDSGPFVLMSAHWFFLWTPNICSMQDCGITTPKLGNRSSLTASFIFSWYFSSDCINCSRGRFWYLSHGWEVWIFTFTLSGHL